jgi:hypothetical protein
MDYTGRDGIVAAPQETDFDSVGNLLVEIYWLPSTTISGREVRYDLGAAPRSK